MLNETWGLVGINGELKPADEAAVGAFDRGFLYGDGIYETIRVYEGKPFVLDAHLARMARGCEVIGLTFPGAEKLESDALSVLRANGRGDAYLRITITRGATGSHWFATESPSPTVFIMTKAYKPSDFGEGLRLMVSSFRSDERSPLSGLKVIGILPKIVARTEAVRGGHDDALLLDTGGRVSEATSSNAFWVRGGDLFTPSERCGILLGITRGVVMEIAARQDIRVREGEFLIEEALGADELLLTSSTWEIAPVRSLGDREYGIGPVTRRLMEGYRERVSAWLGGMR